MKRKGMILLKKEGKDGLKDVKEFLIIKTQ